MLGFDFSPLSSGLFFAFGVCLIMTFIFEFVNGFHDTANAVATVIYTKTLKPTYAVIWSGICNFAGVLFSVYVGGLVVATKLQVFYPSNH